MECFHQQGLQTVVRGVLWFILLLACCIQISHAFLTTFYYIIGCLCSLVIKAIIMNCFFRLILTMDPRHGELSRAMRNRGIEICMLGEVNLHFTESCFI